MADAATTAERIGWPVVVKVVGVDHKSDVDGVALDLYDGSTVEAAATRMAATTGTDRVLVEEQAGGSGVAAELLVTVRREDPVGWLLVIGTGGTLVEVLADRRLARMGGEMEESDKARVYLFHLEFR